MLILSRSLRLLNHIGAALTAWLGSPVMMRGTSRIALALTVQIELRLSSVYTRSSQWHIVRGSGGCPGDATGANLLGDELRHWLLVVVSVLR